MSTVYSFPPIADANARILILGSMPGVASLNAQQYYAHPRNAFWSIMQSIFNIHKDQAYAARVAALKQCEIAVWDVLQQCERKGSLDAAIQPHSRVPNDFARFLATHTHIHTILFNGAEAAKSFQRYVAPSIDISQLTMHRLPSTSPAHTMPIAEKIRHWQDALPASR